MRQSIRTPYTEYSDAARPILKLMERIQGEATLALRDRGLLAQHNTVQLGSVVLLSGFLESFLRAVCEGYFAELLSKGYGMNQLGQQYLTIHLREGAGHLSDLVKRELRQKNALTESSAFVRRLVAPIMDTAKSPVWEAFARTQGNPSPDVLKTILDGLGIKGGFTAIEAALGKQKYSASTLAQLLKNLNDLRNECAHSGTAQSVPQPSTIVDLVQFTRHLALAVCRLVDQKITELTTP